MSSTRRGLTLVELLVVIVILMMITAIAIPVLSPNVEQKRIREAARLVSGFLTGAKTRAQATGRPVGVLFERLSGNLNASMTLSYVEVPPPYSGESATSCCRIYKQGGVLKIDIDPSGSGDFTGTLLSVGDLVKVNHQGHVYRITGPATIDNTTNVLTIVPQNSSAHFPWKDSTDGQTDSVTTLPLATYPYQIARQPVKSAGVPLQMPEGSVVDISASGSGTSGLFTTTLPATPTDTTPLNVASTDRLVVMFGASGALSMVQIGGAAAPTSGGLHFLIGRPDGVNTVTTPIVAPTVANLADLNNQWVSVNSQTGMVSTAENGKYQGSNNPIEDARAIAVTSQSMGGR